MNEHTEGRRSMSAAVLVTAAVVAGLVVGIEPADGAYPGANGRIAFESSRDGDLEIYTMNPDGSDQLNLTNSPSSQPRANRDPVWSPDGTRIAYVEGEEGPPTGEGHNNIYVMNADGSGQTNLTPGPIASNEANGGIDPTWSPDGTRIAYKHSADIWVMNADGGAKTQLTEQTTNGFPAWSPDGTTIAFVRNFDIWVMDADGSDERPLTATTGSRSGEKAPDWSPDGSQLAYERAGDLWVMDGDGSDQTLLAPGALLPAWSPDGTKITFHSSSFGAPNGPDIFVMDADGTDVTRLVTPANTQDLDPNWRPVDDSSTTSTSSTSTSSTSTSTSTSTTSTSTTSTSTTSPPTSTTSTTLAPSDGPVQLDGDAQSRGGTTGITGTITCAEASRYRIQLTITQGDRQAQGTANGSCTGEPQRFLVKATGDELVDGPASVQGTAEIGVPGSGVAEEYTVEGQVEI